MRTVRSLALLAAALLTVAGAAGSDGELPESYRTWLEEVAPLISEAEREAFLSLDREHRRRAFVEAFWRTRDPFPDTARNEFQETWTERVATARRRFGALTDDRALAVLLAGPPNRVELSPCPQRLRTLELWIYSGRGMPTGAFSLVFVPRGDGGYRLWIPAEGLRSLVSWPSTGGELGLADDLRAACMRGEALLEDLAGAADRRLLDGDLWVPRPPAEWVAAFIARSTELPAEADTFAAELELSYPGRQGSRTVVQALVRVPRGETAPGPPESPAYRYLVDGEILRAGGLFEDFRYRFDLPATPSPRGDLPLVIQRYLRPGEYTALLKVRDLVTGRYFRVERPLRVPRVAAEDAAAAAGPPAAPATGSPGAAHAQADLLAEANAALDGGDQRLTLVAPLDRLLTGSVRVEARAGGNRIHKVTFLQDGRPVMSKSRAPYSVELNLGRAPRLHRIEAVAYDAHGREVARDRLPLNSGPHRFAVRLIEPRPGGRYLQSLRAHAEVDVPLGAQLERVEIYLNESRLATLYQPPFVQPVVLPEGQELTYVRALAFLADGNATEDLVFVNAPENLERIEVDFVELYTTVVDRRGRPVEDLGRDDFEVYEDGERQQILRFERVRDLPIHAAVVIDASTSMAEELREVERAALRFFERVIQPKDRAAVWVFSDRPELKVPLTNNLQVLAGGLAGITAEGETALYDSLVESVFYFAGLRGKRALILLSDGHDSASRHTFDETLEFASRSGIAIYSIGISLPSSEFEVRHALQRLARETGGEAFFVDRASQLEGIYGRIEEELRSQYLLGYQSSQSDRLAFRRVEVRLGRDDVEVKTIPGYHP